MSTRKGEDQGSVISFRTPEKRSGLFIFYASVFILFAISSWGLLGYGNLSAIITVWVLIILSVVYLVYSVSISRENKLIEKLPYLSLALSLYLFVLIGSMFYPGAVQDEIIIDTYSAYLFLHGVDPYVASNMANVFVFFHFPPSLTTPLRAGGYVYYLIYPALSIYAFVPSVYFNLPNYTVLLIFNVLTFFLLIYYYRKKGFSNVIPFLILLVFLQAELIASSFSGVTDIIWTFFLAAAYISRKKPWLAGVFLGLSIAQKQIPALVAPFLLYLIFQENDKSASAPSKTFIYAALVFIGLNLPFILLNPGAWLSSMLFSLEQPILGVGFGFGALSFAGYYPIPAIVFSDLLIASLAFLFILYIRYFKELKYAFFAFPIIIFLFNFRSLENYVIYWPLLTMLVLPDFLLEQRNRSDMAESRRLSIKPFFTGASRLLKKSNFTAFLLVIVVLGGAFSAGYSYHASSQYQSQFVINNITEYKNPVMANSQITGMSVNISYSPVDKSLAPLPALFRVIPDQSIRSNINALLWSSPNPYLYPGNNTILIYPNSYSDFLGQNKSFTLEAYYGNITAYFHSSTPVLGKSLIQDPTLLYPTGKMQEPYPGWNLSVEGNVTSIKANSGGVYLQSNATRSGLSMIGVSTGINLEGLSKGNYSLNYTIATRNNSSTGPNGSIIQFVGILLSFNSGQENYWIGYNSSAKLTVRNSINRFNQSILTDSTVINFREVYNYLSSQGWGFTDGKISIMVASKANATISAVFSNFSLEQNGTSLQSFINHGVSLVNNDMSSFKAVGLIPQSKEDQFREVMSW